MKLTRTDRAAIAATLLACCCYEAVHASQVPLLGDSLLRDELNCPINIPLSCSNSTSIADSCCFEYPGGIFLQTQFWDYSPPIGANDTFTNHGLWPDNCSKDGTFQQFCNPKLNVNDVADILVSFNETELLRKMKQTWKNLNGNDESLWKHEFNKHGTCISTLNPSCYSDEEFRTNINVVDYFRVANGLYETLPTFQWLEARGIVPSLDKTYSKQEISDALQEQFGAHVFFSCDRQHALNEVWYFHQIKGSLRSANFHRIDAFSSPNCPDDNIKFLPKVARPHRPAPPRNPSKPGHGDADVGFVKLTGQPGCLIRNGQWYASGTCATYRLEKAPFGGYNLRTNAGYCNINTSNEFSCTSRNQPFQFGLDEGTGILSINGKDLWHSDKQPTRFAKIPVVLGAADGAGAELEFKLKFVKH